MFCFFEKKRLRAGQEIEIERCNQFLQLIEIAKNDWRFSVKLLDETTDPDLIDYAVYLMKSNEAKYRYLMKIARKENWSAKM